MYLHNLKLIGRGYKLKTYIEATMKVVHSEKEPIYVHHYDQKHFLNILVVIHKTTDYIQTSNHYLEQY